MTTIGAESVPSRLPVPGSEQIKNNVAESRHHEHD